MDAHQATLRVCGAPLRSTSFFPWLTQMNPPETSQPPFFKKFSLALDSLRSLFSLLIFFCKQKNHCFGIEKECCAVVFYFQEIDVWILIKQSQNTLSIFSQVYWPLWFCVQTSICSHVPYIDSFLPIFLWECNGWKLDIKWGEMLLVSNSDHKRHLNYNNIVNRNCHNSKSGNIRVLKMSIVQMFMYWKQWLYILKFRFLIIKSIHKALYKINLNHKGAWWHPNIFDTKRVSSFGLIFCSQLWKWFVGSTTHQR